LKFALNRKTRGVRASSFGQSFRRTPIAKSGSSIQINGCTRNNIMPRFESALAKNGRYFEIRGTFWAQDGGTRLDRCHASKGLRPVSPGGFTTNGQNGSTGSMGDIHRSRKSRPTNLKCERDEFDHGRRSDESITVALAAGGSAQLLTAFWHERRHPMSGVRVPPIGLHKFCSGGRIVASIASPRQFGVL
jgi:hypothetical protein